MGGQCRWRWCGESLYAIEGTDTPIPLLVYLSSSFRRPLSSMVGAFLFLAMHSNVAPEHFNVARACTSGPDVMGEYFEDAAYVNRIQGMHTISIFPS
jgi:hypothetical protein